MTDVIEGASVSIKTMADGTLRLTVDIEPRNVVMGVGYDKAAAVADLESQWGMA